MNGDTVVLIGALLMFGALALAGWLGFQNIALTREAQETNRKALEVIEKQNALIAAGDALTYQAIRAMDHVGSYDDGSTAADEEESADEDGAGWDSDGEFGGGDPFVEGNVFRAGL